MCISPLLFRFSLRLPPRAAARSSCVPWTLALYIYESSPSSYSSSSRLLLLLFLRHRRCCRVECTDNNDGDDDGGGAYRDATFRVGSFDLEDGAGDEAEPGGTGPRCLDGEPSSSSYPCHFHRCRRFRLCIDRGGFAWGGGGGGGRE